MACLASWQAFSGLSVCLCPRTVLTCEEEAARRKASRKKMPNARSSEEEVLFLLTARGRSGSEHGEEEIQEKEEEKVPKLFVFLLCRKDLERERGKLSADVFFFFSSSSASSHRRLSFSNQTHPVASCKTSVSLGLSLSLYNRILFCFLSVEIIRPRPLRRLLVQGALAAVLVAWKFLVLSPVTMFTYLPTEEFRCTYTSIFYRALHTACRCCMRRRER